MFLLKSQSNKRARSYLSCRQKARMLTLPTGESEKTERLKRKHYERVAQVAHGRASVGCEFVRFRQHEMRALKDQLSVATSGDSYRFEIPGVLVGVLSVPSRAVKVHGQGWELTGEGQVRCDNLFPELCFCESKQEVKVGKNGKTARAWL